MKIRFKIKKAQYVLTSDSRNFILGVERKSEKGNVQVKDHTYYSTVGGLLESVYQMGLKDNDVTTFRGLIKHSEDIKELVSQVEQQFTFQGA